MTVADDPGRRRCDVRFWKRQTEHQTTVVDTISDRDWMMLTNDEQRFLYIIERRQLGRATAEQYASDLDDFRRGMAFHYELLRARGGEA